MCCLCFIMYILTFYPLHDVRFMHWIVHLLSVIPFRLPTCRWFFMFDVLCFMLVCVPPSLNAPSLRAVPLALALTSAYLAPSSFCLHHRPGPHHGFYPLPLAPILTSPSPDPDLNPAPPGPKPNPSHPNPNPLPHLTLTLTPPPLALNITSPTPYPNPNLLPHLTLTLTRVPP
jgi:hypothetical protein